MNHTRRIQNMNSRKTAHEHQNIRFFSRSLPASASLRLARSKPFLTALFHSFGNFIMMALASSDRWADAPAEKAKQHNKQQCTEHGTEDTEDEQNVNYQQQLIVYSNAIVARAQHDLRLFDQHDQYDSSQFQIWHRLQEDARGTHYGHACWPS